MLDRFRPLLWPLAFLLLAAVLWMARAPDATTDVLTFRDAATRVLAGASPYPADDARAFVHLPIVALLLTPLGLIDPQAAAALWFTVSAAMMTFFVRWSIHGLPERRRSDETLQWLVLVVMLPFFAHELLAGQLTVLVGTLIVVALLAVQVDLPRVGGALVACAVLLKPQALLLVPWLALAHGIPAVVATGTVLGLALLVPALVFGWTGNVELLATWFRIISDAPPGSLSIAQSASVGSMWVTWLGPTRLALFLSVVLVGALLGVMATVWAYRRLVLEPDYLDVALVLVLMPLLSANSSVWLFVLAAPAVAFLLDRWGVVSSRWRVATGLALAVLMVSGVGLFSPWLAGAVDGGATLSVAGLTLALCTANIRWKLLA